MEEGTQKQVVVVSATCWISGAAIFVGALTVGTDRPIFLVLMLSWLTCSVAAPVWIYHVLRHHLQGKLARGGIAFVFFLIPFLAGFPLVVDQYRRQFSDQKEAHISAPEVRPSPSAIATFSPIPSPTQPSTDTRKAPRRSSLPEIDASNNSGTITIVQPGGVVINNGPPSKLLSASQEEVFISTLKGLPTGAIFVECETSGGTEPCQFAEQINRLLRIAGWKSEDIGHRWTMGDRTIRPYAQAIVKSAVSTGVERFRALAMAFQSVGLDLTARPEPTYGDDQVGLFINGASR